MRTKTIKNKMGSPMVDMGPIRLRQPLPAQGVDMVDPFLLLHHYGPYAISAFNNPFDLGPHPHRGFEPITLLFKGEQWHRDSLGNEMLVKAGDVQWTTAGRGIIHAEGPAKEFVERGGDLEGIQLWLNLPAEKKMMTPHYQHVKSEDISTVEDKEGNFMLKVIAGEQKGVNGKVLTQTEVNVFTADVKDSGKMTIDIPVHHESLIYLLDGEVLVNNEATLKRGQHK
ncbi:pirin family protein [Tenacibaculum sp. MAR_2009_124]|uniref:pirin family protein n=1 Tax=Tenacibaculum sp. MAR_2009_124 TaxID=1250059 RepID=UPI000AD198AB|nr:pirin family protein [Tenacibaculum sp. MAR_2009_124]